MEKRYYWLKLKDDFFDSIRIKKLRQLAGGDTFTIIYLKMLLVAIKTDGILEFQGVEENIAEEIALAIGENVENVTVTLKFLLSCGLAEQVETDCFLPEATLFVGSEGSSAERVRNFRERQKSLQCNTDVTQVKQICNGEKREKKQEKEKREKKQENREEIPYFTDLELDATFREFLDVRKKLKAPNSDYAIAKLMKKLDELSGGNPVKAKEIVDQSIMNGWKGVFPVKESKDKTPEQKHEDFIEMWRNA